VTRSNPRVPLVLGRERTSIAMSPNPGRRQAVTASRIERAKIALDRAEYALNTALGRVDAAYIRYLDTLESTRGGDARRQRAHDAWHIALERSWGPRARYEEAEARLNDLLDRASDGRPGDVEENPATRAAKRRLTADAQQPQPREGPAVTARNTQHHRRAAASNAGGWESVSKKVWYAATHAWYAAAEAWDAATAADDTSVPVAASRAEFAAAARRAESTASAARRAASTLDASSAAGRSYAVAIEAAWAHEVARVAADADAAKTSAAWAADAAARAARAARARSEGYADVDTAYCAEAAQAAEAARVAGRAALEAAAYEPYGRVGFALDGTLERASVGRIDILAQDAVQAARTARAASASATAAFVGDVEENPATRAAKWRMSR
jgi:hypothetical protein